MRSRHDEYDGPEDEQDDEENEDEEGLIAVDAFLELDIGKRLAVWDEVSDHDRFDDESGPEDISGRQAS